MKYKVKYLETIRHDRDAIKAYLDQYSTVAAKDCLVKSKAKWSL